MKVRVATRTDYSTVRSICNAAMLDVDPGLYRRSAVLVAESDGPIVGAVVLHGDEIEAIAVRPGRRGQGIGTTLVEAAARRRPHLAAGFDPAVRPFYERLGFDVSGEDDRCRGVLETVG